MNKAGKYQIEIMPWPLMSVNEYLKHKMFEKIFGEELSKEKESEPATDHSKIVSQLKEILDMTEVYGVTAEVLAEALINVAVFAKYRKDTDGIIAAVKEACHDWDVNSENFK